MTDSVAIREQKRTLNQLIRTRWGFYIPHRLLVKMRVNQLERIMDILSETN